MAQPQPPSLNAEIGRVTGDQLSDLRVLSNAAWFVFNLASVNTQNITTDPLGYVAFGQQYFGVSVDWAAVARWESTADQIDTIAAGLLAGVQRAEDVRTLDAFFDSVTALTDYLTTRAPQFRTWASNAGLSEIGLGGFAVDLIKSTLDNYATALDGWHGSLRTRSDVSLPGAIDNARVLLRQWNHDVAASWADVQRQGLRGRIRQRIDSVIEAVRNHLVSAGIVLGTPNYLFDDWDPAKTQAIVTQSDTDAFHARVERTIVSVLGSFPQGSLQSPATWAAINRAITESVTPLIDQVSAVARDRRVALQTSYIDLTTGLDPSFVFVAGLDDPEAVESPPPDGVGALPDPDPDELAQSSPEFFDGPGGVDGGSGADPDGAGNLAGGPGEFTSDSRGFAGSAGPGFPGGAGAASAESPDLGGQAPPDGSWVDNPPTNLAAGPGPVALFSTDATASAIVLPGPVIGNSQEFLSLGPPSSDSDSEPAGAGGDLGDTVGAVGIGAVGPLFLPAGARVGPATEDDDERSNRSANAVGEGGVLAADTSVGSTAAPAALGSPPPDASPAGTQSASGAEGRLDPVNLRAGLADSGLFTSGDFAGPGGEFDSAALDSRVGGGGRAGLARSAEPSLVPASPVTAYQSPGFWPPGTYGPALTQFAGSPIAYGNTGAVGGAGERVEAGLRFRDMLRWREAPDRLAALYGNDLSGQPRRPAGRDEPYRSSARDRSRSTSNRLRTGPDREHAVAEDELDRGRVVPHESDESWSPLPGRPAGGVIAPVDDSEAPETYASVAVVGLLVGAAQRRKDDDDDDDEYDDDGYRDKTRRGLANGVVDAGGE